MASTSSTLLQGPAPASCTSERIDFVNAKLPEYAKYFAVLIHDLLSTEECNAFLHAAEETAQSVWEQAMVNVGGGRQMLVTDTRNCGRIIWDHPTLAARLLERIIPHLPKDIIHLTGNALITGQSPVRRKETWRLSRLNERLRFLKYTSGMYFRPHCDGSYVTPDGKEVSFLTVHIYLNGETASRQEDKVSDTERDNSPLVGGATRFFSMSTDDYLDVEPKTGSCVVFQHRNLVHSGEDVLEGTKYTVRTDVMYEKVA